MQLLICTSDGVCLHWTLGESGKGGFNLVNKGINVHSFAACASVLVSFIVGTGWHKGSIVVAFFQTHLLLENPPQL